MTTTPSVPMLIAAHAGRLRLATITLLLEPSADDRRASSSRVASLAGCHHASLQAATPFIFGWIRPHRGGPITVLTTSPVTGAGLVYPPASRGHLLEPAQAAGLLTSASCWTQLHLRHDALITPAEPQIPAPLDETLLDVWTEPFAWLLHATPVPPHDTARLATEAAETEREARTRANSPAYDIAADRARARHRELRSAETIGAWRIQLLAGATDTASAATLAGLLATAIDLTSHGYALTPGGPVESLDHAINDTEATTIGTPALAALATPPAGEIPGISIQTRSTFTVTPPSAVTGLQLGTVMDRSEHAAGDLILTPESLARHTFVTGATGSGKTTTIQHLLAQATKAGLPWLVIEPAKAEYRHHLAASVWRIGDLYTPALGINPLQPAAGFPLRTHADMVKALLVATFRADEPFPQIMSTAIEDCYRDTGWNIVLGTSLWIGYTPRWPTLTNLKTAALRAVTRAGYGPEVAADVTGFLTVRLDSLTTGTAGSFLNPHHEPDLQRLLRDRVILELEDIGDDTDKAVVMGTLLMRLTQHLRTHHAASGEVLRHLTVIEEAHRLLRRPGHDGAAASAVEAFADMLAEIRAYGEGLIIADQIPAKLITDVVKNTAIKIVHRLPGRDDRDTVGATINTTQDQSDRIVALPPGTAAVATGGMNHPALVRIPAAAPAQTQQQQRIRSASSIATIGDLAHATALTQSQPLFAIWADLTALAHLLALPHPTPKPALTSWLHQQEPRRLQLALEQLATASVHARTAAIGSAISPQALVQHVTGDLTNYLTAGSQCQDSIHRWRLHPFRYNPARRALRICLHHNARADRHPDSAMWQQWYGHPIAGDTAEEQLIAVEAFATRAEAAVARPERLLFGEPHILAAYLRASSHEPGWPTMLAAALDELTIPSGWAADYLLAGQQ